ncbi:tetratricopeptide repeat protein [Streptomyces sp. NPDC047070]|uniref:tetratricopeptide repeat protein n=1 Tax=Streptomyces sp. NPDC047070 TaxID=3154923 RepID=UPI0034541E34
MRNDEPDTEPATEPHDDTEPQPPPALYGEPFDSGLERAELHQLTPDLPAALAVYAELLTVAESFEDSPDVRLLRGHLLSNIAAVQLTATDLPGAGLSVERALGLVRGVADVPMGPRGHQLWLEILLKTLKADAELSRRTGDLDAALATVDEATALLPGFDDPEGLRTAEFALARVHLLLDRSEWGAAEELAAALLPTTPAIEPQLLDCLGIICASTGRAEPAEDHFARADEGYQALGDTSGRQQLISHRAYAAMRAGDLDRAEQLYAEASAIFERQGRSEDLAVCEQARAFLAEHRGDADGGEALAASSLARFERLGAMIAAADTMLLGARQAYDRGDIDELKRLAQSARDVYQERALYERCAQVDLMLAKTLEDNLNRTDHGDHERRSVDTALSLALPAALALEAARYDFAGAHARSQWLQLADDGMRLAFRLALRRQDQGLIFELVEHRCAGASLVLSPADRTPTYSPGPGETPVFPDAAMKTYAPSGDDAPPALGGVAAEAAASAGLRVAPPPRVRMAAGTDRTALQEYIQAAEFRYHRRIVSEEEVPFWSPTS